MFELAFCESAAGGLKMAKSMSGRSNSSTVDIPDIGKEQCKANISFNCSDTIVNSISNEIVVLTLNLEIGDISSMDSQISTRKKLFDDLYAGFAGVSEAMWDTNFQSLKRMQDAKVTLEPVRMWISDVNPAELCGLYFVSYFMADSRTPLSVVRVPEQIEMNSSIVNCRRAGELPPEMFVALAGHEQQISELQRGSYAEIWKCLMRENSPLRAVINGNLVGVPEDFYDFALRVNIPDGEFRVAQLIGKTMCQISGVNDRWLFLRIQAMLQSGELIMVSKVTDDYPYSDIVKRKLMT